MSISDLRKEYSQASLAKADTLPEPVAQFEKWLDEAIAAAMPEPTAMSLATVDANGRPSSRIVLLKQFDPTGFVWYTNYASRKGHDLQNNAHAALLFHWVELERQVRIEGKVMRISAAESDAYFESRPLGSRLGAIASAQSEPITDRAALERRFAATETEQGMHPIRPAHWGGYRLEPDYLEFWQGRRSRLHDRIAYALQPQAGWKRERLQP
ncbi:MAG: pyridoxamine 5'-phosphate oxidase [Pseudomonadota bacterium]